MRVPNVEHLEHLKHASTHKTQRNTEFQPGTPGTFWGHLQNISARWKPRIPHVTAREHTAQHGRPRNTQGP